MKGRRNHNTCGETLRRTRNQRRRRLFRWARASSFTTFANRQISMANLALSLGMCLRGSLSSLMTTRDRLIWNHQIWPYSSHDEEGTSESNLHCWFYSGWICRRANLRHLEICVKIEFQPLAYHQNTIQKIDLELSFTHSSTDNKPIAWEKIKYHCIKWYWGRLIFETHAHAMWNGHMSILSDAIQKEYMSIAVHCVRFCVVAMSNDF